MILAGCQEELSHSPQIEPGKKSLSFTQTSGMQTVKITASNAWTAVSSVGWLTVSPEKGGAGTRELTLTALQSVSKPSGKEMKPSSKQQVATKQAKTKEPKAVAKTTSAPAKTTASPNRFLLGSVGLGIKTNVLLFAGLLPDGAMYSPVANGAVEVYFMDRFLAQLSFAYATPYYKGDEYNLFSLSNLTVEPRWWLWGGSRFSGLYAGVYGQYGSFNVRIKEKLEDNSTGLFYGGGISVGWLQPIWRGFYAEAGVLSSRYRRCLRIHPQQRQQETGNLYP